MQTTADRARAQGSRTETAVGDGMPYRTIAAAVGPFGVGSRLPGVGDVSDSFSRIAFGTVADGRDGAAASAEPSRRHRTSAGRSRRRRSLRPNNAPRSNGGGTASKTLEEPRPPNVKTAKTAVQRGLIADGCYRGRGRDHVAAPAP